METSEPAGSSRMDRMSAQFARFLTKIPEAKQTWINLHDDLKATAMSYSFRETMILSAVLCTQAFTSSRCTC